MKLLRDGEQSGVVTKALRNIKPSFASRSMFGVLTIGWPVLPNASQRRSSTKMKTMLGRVTCTAWLWLVLPRVAEFELQFEFNSQAIATIGLRLLFILLCPFNRDF